MLVVEDLIPIGQFAALTWLSPKALRIYHEQGLLVPAAVDPDTGYRSYAPSQISVASRIGLLQRAGVGLADIGEFLAKPTTARVDEWRTALEAEVAERRRMLDHIARLTTDEEPTGMTTETNDRTASTLTRAIPVLASLDLDDTQRFYRERLGFDAIARYPDYAICGRDDVQVHFWLTDDPAIAAATSCRIDVAGIDALYAELTAAGVVHPNGHLAEQPWGMKEFAVLDGDGNLIKFAERTPG
jgi:DNA-binding transcriptional MerR regulator